MYKPRTYGDIYEMDERAAKLALARKKLKDHQEKKSITPKDDSFDIDYVQQQNQVHTRDITTVTVQETVSMDNEIPTYISNNSEQNDINAFQSNMHITELLISTERNMEMRVKELQSKYLELESKNTTSVNDLTVSKNIIEQLETDLKKMRDKFLIASEELQSKDRTINDLLSLKSSIAEANSNFQEQLEFTKAVLTEKEAENLSLQSHLQQLQNQLEVTQLQLQQLNTGVSPPPEPPANQNLEQNEILLQKISSLEQQLIVLQKEKQQMSQHYEHYVSEINQQLQVMVNKNTEQNKEIQELCNRENGLIDQISDMEIRLQNFQRHKETVKNEEIMSQKNSVIDVEIQEKYNYAQEQLKDLNTKYTELQKLLEIRETEVSELAQQINLNESQNESISLTKLNADIASDKIAAQLATEQNKKLKVAMQELEEAFVKMSQDKLELTEKLVAEKFLNRELTIKLAEIEEKSKSVHSKIKAKDEEMIRLQSNCREIERKFEKLLEDDRSSKSISSETCQAEESHTIIENVTEEKYCQSAVAENAVENTSCNGMHTNGNLPVEDAMGKLQERFLKIMGDVAELSDEKHRLEHIILQLQNETDTICEYVALYQQQRSLLKKRDEERSSQIKVFQMECDQLKSQLEELSGIILRISEDRDLASHFQTEARHNDIARVMELLSNLRNSSLVDPKRTTQNFKDFYPCACCSGQLIDI